MGKAELTFTARRYMDFGEHMGNWEGSVPSSCHTKPCDRSGAKAILPV